MQTCRPVSEVKPGKVNCFEAHVMLTGDESRTLDVTGFLVPGEMRENSTEEEDRSRQRREFGGLKLGQAKRLKELEKENSRVKQLVAAFFPPG